MANLIKADNGVSSGVTGIVQTADSSGQLALQTTTSGGTATTALTIDNSQNVGVGTNTPTNKITSIIAGNNAGATDYILSGGSATYQMLGIGEYTASNAIVIANKYSGGGNITFRTGSATPAEVLRITSAGNLQFQTSNAGIVFNNSSALTNSTLNDYETGTWTPTKGSGLTTTGTFSVTGTYTKIGRLVTANFSISATTLSCTNAQLVAGLPFSHAVDSTGSNGVLVNSVPNAFYGLNIYGSGVNLVGSGLSSTQAYGSFTYVATF
jgi:hypothetical protein